jgi:hypothetical protein
MMIRPTHRLLTVTMVGCVALALAVHGRTVQGHEHDGDDADHAKHDRYTIALFGDMPYGALGKAQYPALLADINDHHVAFSVFDGDLEAGGDGPCSDENLYFPALASFGKLARVETFGSRNTHWVSATIDESNPNLFLFDPRLVPGND